jgi:peptidyl-tRNA hydrolase ICT1
MLRPALSTPFAPQGGQNVNKVNTKAELRFNIASADWLDSHTKGRLLRICRNNINNDGELVITSQRLRTQEGNLEDAFAKLHEVVKEAASIPKVRAMRTGLSELTKTGYREDKRHRSEVKERRKPPRGRDDD